MSVKGSECQMGGEGQGGVGRPTSCPSSHINTFIDHYCFSCSPHPASPGRHLVPRQPVGKQNWAAPLLPRPDGDSWQKLGGHSICESSTGENCRESCSPLPDLGSRNSSHQNRLSLSTGWRELARRTVHGLPKSLRVTPALPTNM